MKPSFPTVLDSTIIAAARSCLQKANLEFFEHWKPREPSVHLHAGAAYAAGMEAARTAFYLQGHSEADSVAAGVQALLVHYGDFECPPDSAKSLERTAGALEFYFSRYRLGEDKAIPMTLPGGKRGIEFSFVEPLVTMKICVLARTIRQQVSLALRGQGNGTCAVSLPATVCILQPKC